MEASDTLALINQYRSLSLEDSCDLLFISHHLEYEAPPRARLLRVHVLRERALELTWRIRGRKRAKERYNSTKSRTAEVAQHPSRGRAEIELAESTGRVYIGIASRKI